MLNDNALELAIDQLLTLKKEIFETLDCYGNISDFKTYYFVLNDEENKVLKCSSLSTFPENNTSNFHCDKVLRRGNLVIVIAEPDYREDFITGIYIFSASKEIKE